MSQDRVAKLREFIEIATDDEIIQRILRLEDKLFDTRDDLSDLRAEHDQAISSAEKAVSYGSAAYTAQTAPIFALAIKNEIFRSLRSTIRKHKTIGPDNFPRVAANIAFRIFRLLALFHIEIDERHYKHPTGREEIALKD